MPASLAFAVGSLNVPVLHELLGYAVRTRQMQHLLAQDGALATDLLLRAATASVLRACCPLQLGWSRGNAGPRPSKASMKGAGASKQQVTCSGNDDAQPQSAGGEQPSSHAGTPKKPLDCVGAATPTAPPLSFRMRHVLSVACSVAACHDSSACEGLNGVCTLRSTFEEEDRSHNKESACMRLYMHPCDENKYVDARGMRVHEMHRLGGGPGIARVSRPLESLGGTPQQAQWHCAATMHVVDALIEHVLGSDSSSTCVPELPGSLCAACGKLIDVPLAECTSCRPFQCARSETSTGSDNNRRPEGAVTAGSEQSEMLSAQLTAQPNGVCMTSGLRAAAGSSSGICPVDWEAILYVLATLEAFPRAFKPARVLLLP